MQLDDALHVFDRFKLLKLQPTTIMYNALIAACGAIASSYHTTTRPRQLGRAAARVRLTSSMS